MNRGTGRGRRALLAAALALTAALGVIGLQPPPAHAAPTGGSAPTGRGALDGLPEGTGMLGYQLLQIPTGTAPLQSIAAVGYDGRVAGQMEDANVPLVPQPWAWAPGGQFQQLEVLDPSAVTHLGGFDGDGNLWGEQLDPATGEDKLLEWKPNGPFWTDPIPVLGGNGFGAGKSADATSVNREGDVLVDNDTIRRADGSLFPLGGGAAYQVAEDGGAWGIATNGGQGAIGHWRKGSSSPDVLSLPPGVTIDQYGYLPVTFRGASDDGHVAVVVNKGSTQEGWLRDPDGTWHLLQAPGGGGFLPIGMTDGGELDAPASRNGTTLDVATQAGARKVWASDLLRKDGAWAFTTANPAQAMGRAGGFAGFANYLGSQVPFVALPVDPLVFVHGAGASKLASYTGLDTPGKELWLGCPHLVRTDLSLFPKDIADGTAPAESGAVDALHHETCLGVSEKVNPALDAYGTMLDTLIGSGTYGEYQVAGKRSRQTSSGCDTSQLGKAPNLFVYAYDWRQDNTLSAEGLADYVRCVQQFWPDRKVDVLTHSMGSLVARRYLIDQDDNPVAKLITVGAPWLGAPKLVNVLQTGEFTNEIVDGDRSAIKYILGSFPAAHELMASRLYTDKASSVPVFQEDGWDINGDGNDHETYTFDQLQQYLDTFAGHPGTTADQFQSTPGQTDWRDDTSGVQFTSIVGLQAGAGTIGTVVAKHSWVCGFGGLGYGCTPQDHIEHVFVCGDGTVPIISAQRAGRGTDWNAPDAEVLTFMSPDASANQSVEHTGLTANPQVLSAIFTRLFSRTPQPHPADHSSLGTDKEDTKSCTTGSGSASVRGFAAAQDQAPDPSDALRYVSLLGGTGLTVTSSDGQSSAVDGPTGGYVTGADVHPSNVADAAEAVLPLNVPTSYRSTFTAGGNPIELTLLEGSQQHPTAATRWIDVAAAKGTAMELDTSADGTDVLKEDSDGDGTPDKVVPPTTRLTGNDALDQTAPTLTGQKVADGTGTHVALTADDGPTGTGVTRILWSTDGAHFQKYDGPVDVADGATVTAFAEDRAGNRSAGQTFAVADLKAAMLTTATLTPAPTGAGWSPGAVTVDLSASAPAGGSPVASVHVATSGAQNTGEATTQGSTASVTVSAAGATTVTFGAVAADGTREPDRTVVVRVDLADPSAGISVPGESAVVDGLPLLRGTAADDASGVAKVEVRLQDAKGRSWDGGAWKDAAAWLTTSGSSTWQRTTGLPAGDDLPRGGYRVTLKVTDNAGRTTTTHPVSFTVAPSAGLAVRELPVGPDASVQTSANAVSTRGVAAGVLSDAQHTLPARWDAGGVTRLTLPDGTTGGRGAAVDDAGRVWGDAGGSAGTSAVRWAPDGTPTVLSTARAGDGFSRVTAVDRTGTWAIGGESADGSYTVAVRWGPDGAKELAVPNGWDHVEVTGVASDGTAYGTALPPPFSTTVSRAVSWDAVGRPHLLPEIVDGEPSAVTAASSTGQVVGTEGRTLVRWVDGAVSTVDSYVPTSSIRAYAIGDDGTVVGDYGVNGSSTRHAFAARPGQNAEDLTAALPSGSGWTLQTAYGVDANGQIVGFGLHGSARRAFAVSVQHAPVTEDTALATPEGSAASVVLDAWDPDAGESLSLKVTGGPAHGTAEIAGTTLRYTPAKGFSGTDTVTYQATDPSGLGSVPGTVTITVGDGTPHDRAPVATSGSASTDAGTAVPVPLSATDPDGDPLTYVVTAQPAHGTLTGTAPTLVYVPAPGFTGDDAFTWHASDGTLDSAPATTTVRVNRVEHAPQVTLQAPASVAEGGQIAVSAPASDADGDQLSWSWTVDGKPVAGAAASTLAVAAGDGPADRQVSVTVSDGTLGVTRSAVVHVDDVAPTVSAGPAVTTPWGVPVTLHGTVTDPSAADTTAGLKPTWDLGDGTTATGTDVTHTWAAPGSVTARLTATDKDGLTGSATTPITVTRHATVVRLTVGGTFGSGTATATLTDGVTGAALPGRPVVLTVDGVAQPALTTGADGSVALARGTLLPGSHTVSATAAGTDRYDAGSAGAVTGAVTGTRGLVAGAVSTAQGDAAFTVASDGRVTGGVLGWHGRDGGLALSVQVTALAVSSDGTSAWFGGITADGKHRLLAYVEDHGSPGKRDVLRLWVDGVEKTTTGQVTAGDVVVTRIPVVSGGVRAE